jgi:hypothetical protein
VKQENFYFHLFCIFFHLIQLLSILFAIAIDAAAHRHIRQQEKSLKSFRERNQATEKFCFIIHSNNRMSRCEGGEGGRWWNEG